jgi:hypothetical protein
MASLRNNSKPIGDVPGDVEGACELSAVQEALATDIKGPAVPVTCQHVDGRRRHGIPALDGVVGAHGELATVWTDDVDDAATKQAVLVISENQTRGLVDHGHPTTCVKREDEIMRVVEVVMQAFPIPLQFACHPVFVSLRLFQRLQRRVDVCGQLREFV